ncbi:TF3B [Hepatospora eriocheir]|uniref:TF3B n=1 Tax=Hepatospora eriocheir TaxID=1081669 RepID=A0A1X0QJ76_9MICR|nr:TF3B [Hepatospora eriocheir]
MTHCFNCNSTELETDQAKGIIYCEVCGMLQEENLIVNTLQYNTEGSKPIKTGQIINVENVNVGTQFVDSSYYIKNTIRNICNKLSLDNSHIEIAFRWYKMSLLHNLTKGKSILYTLSACVYISCRQANTPHLLMDFSDVLRIDVFKIGKIFMKMRKLYKIEIKLTDPLMYMHRFITQLKLKHPEIFSIAVRLLNRIKKDWIMEGRRPNNACGAAILLASRICGEPRDIKDVAKTVHSSVATINKRLKEISETQTAHLNIKEFKESWIDVEENPPVNKISKFVKEESEEINEFDSDEYILNENEIQDKTKVWDLMYNEYVKEMQLKKKNAPAPRTIKKRRKSDFETVEDALKSLGKKVTSKINLNALNNLFD